MKTSAAVCVFALLFGVSQGQDDGCFYAVAEAQQGLAGAQGYIELGVLLCTQATGSAGCKNALQTSRITMQEAQKHTGLVATRCSPQDATYALTSDTAGGFNSSMGYLQRASTACLKPDQPPAARQECVASMKFAANNIMSVNYGLSTALQVMTMNGAP